MFPFVLGSPRLPVFAEGLVDVGLALDLLHHPEEHHRHGGLAGARPPHDGHFLAAPDPDADVLKAEVPAPVGWFSRSQSVISSSKSLIFQSYTIRSEKTS